LQKFTQILRPKPIPLAIGFALVVALGIFSVRILLRPDLDDRVYTIGWQHVPPFQQQAPDGSPSGLAVDLVRDAARRRGIRLRWVWHPGSSEAALRNREVDLWPIITITPEREREKAIYISKPYLQHDHVLLVLASSGYFQVQDLRSASIAHVDLPISTQLLRRVLPKASPIPVARQKNLIDSVCSGRAAAAFLDEFTASAVLLSLASCASNPLRVIGLPGLRSRLGVGSTLEARQVADEIRRGIDASAIDGELARILMNGSYYSSRNMEYFGALLNQQRRDRWLVAIASVFAALLALVAFAADRIRRQRNRIKITGDALRDREQKLRLMTNSLSEMVLAYDMDRRLIFANSAVQKITGYSTEALQRYKSICWVHPDDRLRMYGHWDKLFQGATLRDEEYRLVTKDGRTRWVIASWGPVFDEGGRQVGVQCSERDITERKRTEQALRESEQRFRELLERVRLVAIIIDRHGIITFFNDYALAITGWRREEVIGRDAKDFINAEYLLQVRDEKTTALLSTGWIQPATEGSLLEKSGHRLWIHWSTTPLRDPAGLIAGFASLGEDVTELRALRAKAAQLESEERFRNMADTVPLMIWMAGPDRSCTFVNKGWLAFTGRALEEELGSGWTANIHPDDLDCCLDLWNRAFDTRRDFQLEYRKLRADGEFRWVFGTAIARYVDGEFAGFVGTCTDITDLKRNRDENVARQKLEGLGRLVGGIAHDFNNFLGGILVQSELALEELAGGESPTGELTNIRNVAIRGSAVVRQLMIYAGQERASPELLDLSFVIDDMLPLLKVVVSKHVTLKTDLGRSLPAVRANSAQLQQMAMNLVTNASEAIGEQDGLVTIRTVAAGPGGDPSQNGLKAAVMLEVSDSGCGIPQDAQSKLFDPFFTTKSPGKGLGLAVVNGIVQGLGGSIRFETERNRGTTFRVLLPAADEMSTPRIAPAPAPAASEPIRAGVVLLVEDEEPLRAGAVKLLRGSGLSVMEAPDGTAAMSLVREQHSTIGVIVLDITMPGVPSREVLAEARRLRPDMKAIVTSAYGPQKVDETFPDMEIDAFVRKPYQLAELVTAVRRSLRQGASAPV
jgi:PAS domain S-box-containing protein